MLQKLFFLFLLLIVQFSTVKSFCQSAKSDFSHIEIIIDSTDFTRLVADSFIRDSLGRTSYDTMQPTPLVVSYYINGEDNFIHFNPNKGYFATQRGTAYIIFQTRRPGQGKLLEQSLKSVTNDSLLSYDYEGADFKLSEVIFKSHGRLHKSKSNHLVPMLSSYSVETYKNLGLGDSVEVSMQKFLSKDAVLPKKLFKKIALIRLSITEDELSKLSAVMKVTGYKLKNNKFIKPGQPEIIYAIDNSLNNHKVTELVLLMNEYKGTKSVDFGNTSLTIIENKAIFLFK